MHHPKYELEDWERDFIEREHAKCTVKEMAVRLDAPEHVIYNYCYKRKLSFKKVDESIANERAARLASIKQFDQETKPKKLIRPPAVYGNIPSPYGLATELHHGKS